VTYDRSVDITEILLNVALSIIKQTNKYRLLGREWLIIDQTMYKNLQYMSTVQVIPSYKQILKANKHNLHTNVYTHWKRFLVVCKVFSIYRHFNSVSVIQ
jgi:hypothetical protein